MASTVNVHRDALLERMVDRISAGFDALVEDVRAYRMRRATAAELRRLTKRELDDIGVSVHDIDAVANGAPPRKH